MALLLTGSHATAQNADDIQKSLIDQPLYLRGFWTGYFLEFDVTGKPAGKYARVAQPGPLTLSGVDVKSVTIKGEQLMIEGERVSLVAKGNGRLQRITQTSTTDMWGTYQRTFKSKDIIHIAIQGDGSGDFSPALKIIFANGLKQLAEIVPPYWKCYSKGYFKVDVDDSEAANIVKACVSEPGLAPVMSAEGFQFPKVIQIAKVDLTHQAAEARVHGESQVHIVVGPHGIPLRFQIVRAVGAGVDEAVLQTISQAKFQPASTKDGTPVASEYTFEVDVP